MPQQFLSALDSLLHERKNEVIGKKQSAYLRDLFPCLGVIKPDVHRMTATLYKTYPFDIRKALLPLWEKEAREYQYAAIFLARKQKHFTEDVLSDFEILIRNKSWWDTVDDLAANLVGPLLKQHPHLQKKMDLWIEDPHLWIRRTALIYQLRYKEKTDEKALFAYCEKLAKEEDFFIRKAIGWALREYGKTKPESVRKFLEKVELSNLSRKEASIYL